MKIKLRLVLILLVVIFTLSACTGETEKKLKCIKMTKEEGMEIQDEIFYEIDNYKVLNYIQTLTTSFDPLYQEYIETYKTTIDNKYKEIEEKKGVIYTSFIENNVYIFKVEVDYTKVNEEDIYSINDTTLIDILNVNNKVSIDKTKNNLEKEGYKCNYEK